jgi:hypothetical protein
LRLSADNFFDLDPVLGRNGVVEKYHGDGSDIKTDEAMAFIRKQVSAGKPFLAVVWFGNPHTPHEALPTDKAPYTNLPAKDQNYYGELTGIDRNVGKLRATLSDPLVESEFAGRERVGGDDRAARRCLGVAVAVLAVEMPRNRFKTWRRGLPAAPS